MSTAFIVSFAGNNRSGLLKELAQVTHNNDGKWLNSKVNYLDGHVAGNIKVSLPADKVDTVKQAFINEAELVVKFSDVASESTAKASVLKLSIHSSDRPGLVHEITDLIDTQQAELLHMESHRLQVVPLGTNVFTADVVVQLPDGVSQDDIVSDINALSADMKTEIVA